MSTINIPVYLQDEDGDLITDSEGNYILIGTITTDEPIGGGNWEEILDTLNLSDVIDGMRLAKNIRGTSLLRFEIVEGEANDYVVTYNRNQFGGRFQSLGIAVGSIAGTYARRGGWVIGSLLSRPSM